MEGMYARILAGLAGAMDGIAARPALPASAPWWRRADDDADRTHGPIWYPSEMLGDGEPLPERVRAQANVALRKLADEGLLVVTPDGGRRRVRLTDKGRAAADAVTTGEYARADE